MIDHLVEVVLPNVSTAELLFLPFPLFGKEALSLLRLGKGLKRHLLEGEYRQILFGIIKELSFLQRLGI
jgi:hypothetical protein